MPRNRECDFCGDDIEPGTGTMLVRKDGTTVHYCSSKCEKNADLGRESRDVEWTETSRGTTETADKTEQKSKPEPEPEPEPETTAGDDADADAEDESETDTDTDTETEAEV